MPTFQSLDFYINDDTDISKQLRFNVSALATSTLRVLKVQAFPGALVTQTLPSLELANIFTANNAFQLGATFSNLLGATVPISIDTTTNTTNAIDVTTTSGLGSGGGNPCFMNVNGHIDADNFFLADQADNTKLISHDVSGIATATTRIWHYLNTTGSPVLVGQAGTGSALLNTVNLTAQSADVTSTLIVNGGPAGFYRVSYVLEDTIADITAGIVTLTISWTDDVGATTATATQALTGTGRSAGTVPLYLASGNISWATTHTGIFGTARYALRMRCEFLG